MENFVMWLTDNFINFISILSYSSVRMINNVFDEWGDTTQDLIDLDIKLVLFSETPILTTNVYDLLLMVFSIFYTVIFVVIVYKIIKKVFVKITGWKRW